MSLPGIIPCLGAQVASGSGSGGGVGAVSITNQSLSAIGSSAQTVGYRLNTSGAAERNRNASYNTLETWLLTGASSDYEAYAFDNGSSASISGSALNTWLGLGTSREWTITQTLSGGSTDASISISIRQAAPPNSVLATATIYLTAIRF